MQNNQNPHSGMMGAYYGITTLGKGLTLSCNTEQNLLYAQQSHMEAFLQEKRQHGVTRGLLHKRLCS